MPLTNRDASLVLGMLARGDYNHDIAAWFGENPARVAEVKGGSHGSISAASGTDLPPKGAVGPKARRLLSAVEAAIAILENEAPNGAGLAKLKDAVAKFNAHSR